MDSKQKIDIIIPIYNGLEYLPKLFESVFKKCYSFVAYLLKLLDSIHQKTLIEQELTPILTERQGRFLCKHSQALLEIYTRWPNMLHLINF